MKSDYGSWDHPNKADFEEVHLSDTQFLIPGFIDTHIHASQVPNIGLGLDKPLLDWLNIYTFPMESQYKDEAFAEHVYKKVVVSFKIIALIKVLLNNFFIMKHFQATNS